MGQMKISEMQLAQQVNKEDYIPIVQGGANKKISAENLMDYNVMKNKPRINGKELSSENSLDYLEIQPKGNYVTKEEFNANDFATAAEVEKKLDKNLGKENSQKVLQISESGEVKAVDAVGGNNVVYKSEVAEPAIINDSFNKVNKGIEIYGQSEQDSTTGAQLLSVDMTVSKLPYSVNGITFSDNGDGGIKVAGTTTGVATLYFNDMINNLEDGETYSYNSDTKLGTLAVSYNDGTPTDYIKTITVNKSKMISIRPYVQYPSGNTVNKVIYPMLNIGNNVKPFEPYTGGKPSPSPDYPQEIISKEVSSIIVSNGASESQTITLSEPITLYGVPVASDGNVTIDGQQYVSDVIAEKDGIIGILRNIIRPILKENLTFKQTPDAPNRTSSFLAFAELDLKSGAYESLSSHFVWKGWGNNTVGSIGWVFATTSTGFYISPPRKADGDYTKEEIETLVNGKWAEIKDDVEFYAQLQEPTFEPLPKADQEAIRALQMYYPTTIVDCGAPVSVTYEASLQTIFEDLTSKINESINLSNKALLYNKD